MEAAVSLRVHRSLYY